ncbi:hypothetical protein P0Y35_00020 [Kiritimatiellaeota bacterium B1221]|nr:hypothetical protein [Kiritimatiellaeota bacterium B1221]
MCAKFYTLSFDTYAEQEESVRLSAAIGDFPYGALVVIAVREDATRRLRPAPKVRCTVWEPRPGS